MLEASFDEAYALYFLIKSPQGDEGRGGHHLHLLFLLGVRVGFGELETEHRCRERDAEDAGDLVW